MAGKTAKKKTVNEKPRYTCKVCGLVVRVDESCKCTDECDIICCGKPMKEKK